MIVFILSSVEVKNLLKVASFSISEEFQKVTLVRF